MSELLHWFAMGIKGTSNRPRAGAVARFTTALHRIDDLLTKRSPASAFIEAFETMQNSLPEGYESKPGNIHLRRRFQWADGRGFLDISQAVNGTRRPFSTDSLLMASMYHVPTRLWHTGFFVESEPILPQVAVSDAFPFPTEKFHSLSFTKKPDFAVFLSDHPEAAKSLRQISVARRGKEYSEKVLGECFVRRIIRGVGANTIAFPHL